MAANEALRNIGGLSLVMFVAMAVMGLLLGAAVPVGSECPRPNDLPVWNNWYNKYTAAQFYQERGGDQPITACIGNAFDIADGNDWNLPVDQPENPDCTSGKCCDGYHGYLAGSWVVRPGCSLYVFQWCDYNANHQDGWMHQHDGPTTISLTPYNTFESMKARCNLAYVDCQPTDQYEVVEQCDATGAIESVDCKYSKTIGTRYETSISNTISVDTTVATHVEATFFDLFSAALDVSTTTGYNWNQVSTEATDVVETFEVMATAPPGTVLVIQQAVGHCGGSQVNTELFKISHQDKDGNLLDVRYELAYSNGTVIPYMLLPDDAEQHQQQAIN